LRSKVGWLALLSVGCTPDGVTVALVGLGSEPPPQVVSLSVTAWEDGVPVASGTVTAGRSQVALGVPAEIPLEFRAVARTAEAGPPEVGQMPAFFGSLLREIPLSRDPISLAITARPAGALTVLLDADPDRPRDRRATLVLEDPAAEAEPIRVRIPPGEDGLRRVLIARFGRYVPRLEPEDPEEPEGQLASTAAVYVARERETIFPLAIVPFFTATPEDPRLVRITVGGGGQQVGLEPFTAEVALLDAAGKEVADPEALVRYSVAATPPSAIAGPPSGSAVGVPATIAGLSGTQEGRATFRVSVERGDRPPLSAAIHFNILPPAASPGPAARLELVLADPEALSRGTGLGVLVLDAAGRLAADVAGTADLSMSDPWVDLLDGPTAIIGGEAAPVIQPRIARASGPAGDPVVVRATVTSTAGDLTLTATLALPLFERP
jgi:hypothetical protein